MKPAAFDYLCPRTLDEALHALATHGDQANVLAGGQSLMPMLSFRLLEPAWVVDINRIPGLDQIQQDGDTLRIGALARHAQVLAHPLVAQHLPLLAQAMPHIAHAAIRERGTLGGSLCLADPAAELPACMLALDARLLLRSQQGMREVAAADFFQGLYQTALAPGELLVEVRIPRCPRRAARWCLTSSAAAMATTPWPAWPLGLTRPASAAVWCFWAAATGPPAPFAPKL